MIGIISDVLEAYPIIYKIHKSINTDIYVCNNKERLIEKNCNIIITNNEDINKNNIYAININEFYKDDYITLDNNIIKNIIVNKDMKELKDYLEKIDSNKPILLSLKEEYLYEYIKNYSNNKIITISDLVLKKVEEIITTNNIKLTNTKNAYYL